MRLIVAINLRFGLMGGDAVSSEITEKRERIKRFVVELVVFMRFHSSDRPYQNKALSIPNDFRRLTPTTPQPTQAEPEPQSSQGAQSSAWSAVTPPILAFSESHCTQ